MADDGNTARQAGTDEESGVHRLRDIVVEEVSLVDRAANKRRFLLVKRSSQMADNGKPNGGTSQEGRTDTTPGKGGRKPRTKPDENMDKSRPRVMRAASDDEKDEDDEDTEKARRSTKPDDEEDDEDKAEKADDEDEDEEDDEEDDEDDEEEEEEEKSRPDKQSSGKPADASGKQRPGRSGKPTRKAEDDALVLPPSVKNAVLRALAQALERLMVIANQVKEADAPDDEIEAGVPDALTGELEAIGELLEDISEQLADPAEKSRGKKPDAAKGHSAKGDVSKAGRRMAKDRLERFQKALELLAAVLKELTEEKARPTQNAGSAEKPLGKRGSPDVGALVASVQELTRVVKRQEEQLVRLQKTRATSNAIPVEGGSRRREIQDVSWPLDMNRPITRDRVDKAISFYDEE
jgi:hypothetical protein